MELAIDYAVKALYLVMILSLPPIIVASVVGIVLNIILPGKADFDAWDGGLAAEAEADDVPLPLEAEVTNLPIREQRRG